MGKNGWNEEKSCDKKFEKDLDKGFGKEFGKDYEKDFEKDFSRYEYIPNPCYQKKNDCCCEKDFEKLFSLLLCNDEFKEILDENATFGFMGKEFFVGAKPNALDGRKDNIEALEIASVDFDPCNCGFISLPERANVYYPSSDISTTPIGSPLKVGKISLCTLDSFGIQFSSEYSFKEFKKTLDECIDKDDSCCKGGKCKKADCKDCCCNESILNQIDCGIGPVSITAGWLTLAGYKFLTNFRNIAIFYSPSTKFFYFICLNSVFAF